MSVSTGSAAQQSLPPWLRHSPARRTALAAGVGALLVLLLALGTMHGRQVFLMAAPIAVCVVLVTIVYPKMAYIGTLCALSLIPIEGYFLSIRMPNWMQIMIPALLISTLMNALTRPERRPFRLNWADVFIVGFLAVGTLGVFGQSGQSTEKFYINQQFMPALMYFIVKWLPINRKTFENQLRWQLLSVLALSLIMLSQTILGIDPFYHGLSLLPRGGEARGPMWSISDTVAYTTIWPPFFLYALGTGLALGRRQRPWLWLTGLIGISLASFATTERTGFLAIFAGLGTCALHPRMGRYLLVGLLIVPIVLPLWLVTPSGSRVLGRLKSMGEEGSGFERVIYREKALNYMRSPNWNPVLGTGFGRLNDLAAQLMPEDKWVMDYNSGYFHQIRDFASRPTHCAPVTLLGEYGYGGMSMLLLVGLSVAWAIATLPLLARRQNKMVDTPLILAAVGAFLAVFANALFHNTEGVVEVLISLWVFAGLLVGHPTVFLMDRVPEPALEVAHEE
ncbi:MAG: O-antigen ligase family protein [Armatimonadota bacterium]